MGVVTNSFHPVDYVVFVMSLVVSLLIGVFFAVRGKQKTQGEYLTANRQMAIIPVAMSMQVSFMSAILILGTPAEMYTQGTTYYTGTFGMILGLVLTALIFVPLQYRLKATSAYEYLELRFNSVGARLVGTLLTTVTQLIYMGIASFAPAIALEAVTGFPVWASIVICNVVTTIYTSIGGIKAVIWTDVFQSFLMLGGMLAVLIQGTMKVGGLGTVWEINDEYKHLNFFEFDPSPTRRHTLWSLTFGMAFAWMGVYGTSQSAVQRFCSLPTMQKAQASVLVNILGGFVFWTIACLSGIVVFAYYVTKDCDILGKRLISNPNQIVPFFVMETLSYPSVPGLFLSSLFAGALSSISSSLNALTALVWEDFMKRRYDGKWSESKKMVFTKSMVIVLGCLSLAIGLVVQTLKGTVMQLSIGLTGSSTGPLCGLFLLAGLFPWANAKGAITGALVSLVVTLWLSLGAFSAGVPRDILPFPNGTCEDYFPLSATGEPTTTTMMTTTIMTTTGPPPCIPMTPAPQGNEPSGIEKLYTLSYLWFSSVGVLTCIIVGLLVSFLTGANSINDVPTKYQIPLAKRLLCCLPGSWKRKIHCNRNFDDCDEEEDDNEKLAHNNSSGVTYDNAAFKADHVIAQKSNGVSEGDGNPESIFVKF